MIRTRRSPQGGLSLVELMIAVAVGALILAGLNSVVGLSIDAQTFGRGANERAYQGSFFVERVVDKARALAPKALATPPANTTGDWFAPAGCAAGACLMYCRNGASQLIETTTSDTACTGTTVVANNVSAFSAALPATMGAIDRHGGTITLTITDSSGASTTLSATMRLGGGTQ